LKFIEAEINSLKSYISDNLGIIPRICLNYQLWLLQELITLVYDTECDTIEKFQVVFEVLIQINLKILDIEVEIFNKIDLISDEDETYILERITLISTKIDILINL